MSHYYDDLDIFVQGPQSEAHSAGSKRLSYPGPPGLVPATENESSEPTGRHARRESDPGRGFSVFSLRGMEEEPYERRRSYAETSSASQSFVSLEEDPRLATSQGPSAWRRETLRPGDQQSYAEMSSATQSFVSFETGLEGTPTHSAAALDNYSDVDLASRSLGPGGRGGPRRRTTSRTGNSPYGHNNDDEMPPRSMTMPEPRQPSRQQTGGYAVDEPELNYGQPSRQPTAPGYGDMTPPSVPQPGRQPTLPRGPGYGEMPVMPEARYTQQPPAQPNPYGGYAFDDNEPHDQSTIRQPARQPTGSSTPSIPEAYGRPTRQSPYGGYSASDQDQVAPTTQIPNPWEATANAPMTSQTPGRQPTQYSISSGRQPTISSASTVSPGLRPDVSASAWDGGRGQSQSQSQPQGYNQPQPQAISPGSRTELRGQSQPQPQGYNQPQPQAISPGPRPELSAGRAGSAWDGARGQSQPQGYNQPQSQAISPGPRTELSAGRTDSSRDGGRGQPQSQGYNNQPQAQPQSFAGPGRDTRPMATPPPATSGRPSAALNSTPSQQQQATPFNRPQQQAAPANIHPLQQHQQQQQGSSFNRPQQSSPFQQPASTAVSDPRRTPKLSETPTAVPNNNKPATPFRPEDHRPPMQQTPPPARPRVPSEASNHSQSRPGQQARPSTNGHPTTYPPSRPVTTEKPAKEVAKTAFTTPHQPIPAVRGPGDTKYISMLLALDDIPPIYNLLASFFTWILLAGFVLFPGTFTNLQQTPQSTALGITAANVVKHVSLYVVAWTCTGIGAAGMLWLWYRWRGNYLWIVNRIFMPGFLNSLAGVLSALSSVLGTQNATLSIASTSTVIVTSATAGICALLAGFYLLFPIRILKQQHDRQVGKQHAGKHGAGYAGVRPRLPGRHGSQMDTKYVNMLLALDSIPTMYNLLTSFFTWILLAGFVLFPGTFTSLQEKPQSTALGITAANVVKHVSLYVVAWACTGIGAAGMLWLWFRWYANYIWLVNRIFLPGLLNSLAGVISTLSSVLGAQDATLSIASTSTIIVTSATAGVCGILTAFYMFVLIRSLKKKHDRQVGKQRAGKHGAGYTDLSKKV